ncbi:MAG: hypothetical protein NZ521_08355, partial [Flammeovirgaceae bacterium]|nr:hypothetical protein [Flammeovirgaceae bacterium]
MNQLSFFSKKHLKNLNSMRVFLFLIFLVTSCVTKNQYAKLEETYKKNVGTVEKLNKQIAQLKDKQKSIKDSIQRICNEINIYKDSFDIVKTYLTENVEKLFEKVELKHKNLYTALREHYLSYEEKEIFYWINLARTQPQYYCKMYVEPLAKKYSDNFYYTSLYETMMKMQPVGIL